MNIEDNTGIKNYLLSGGYLRLVGSLFNVSLLIAVGWYLPRLGQRASDVVVLVPLIRDPFTVLAACIFCLSYLDLEFMEFRLTRTSHVLNTTRHSLRKQVEIPKAYKNSFGPDIFWMVWRYRLAFVASFGIATLRWVWGWK